LRVVERAEVQQKTAASIDKLESLVSDGGKDFLLL